jgi:tetratricopeptide (TPR) repeat protein
MRRSCHALCFVLCVLVCPHVAYAQLPNSRSAAGTVFADGGAARLQDVMVRLHDSGGRTVLQSATSSSGQFNFNGLPAGMYLLELQAAGFQNAEVRLDLSFSSESGLTIYLKPVVTSTVPSAAGASISAHELSIPEGVRKLYIEGKKKLYGENKAQEALADFEKALKQVPEFYEARYQVGMAYLGVGKTEDAEKSFRKCIADSHDKYGNADIALGTLQLDRGETEAGENQIRHGLELSPYAWMGYYQLGRLEALRGQLESAETYADQARRFSPATALVYQLLANIHMKQKNYSALLDDIDAYVRLDPNSPAGIRAKEIREKIQKQMQEEAAATR